MTKTETLAREVLTALNNGVDPLLVNATIVENSPLFSAVAVLRSRFGASMDLSEILDLIIDFLTRLFTLWNEQCKERQFARMLRGAGPFQRAKARSEWDRLQRSRQVDTGLSARDVVNAAYKVSLAKDDAWLDEAAREPSKPNWGF